MAFKQGLYNLFLAIIAAIGVLTSATPIGVAFIVASAGSMVGAAIVLVLSDHSKFPAGAVQGVLPLLALVALLIARL